MTDSGSLGEGLYELHGCIRKNERQHVEVETEGISAMQSYCILDVIGHSPWGFSGPILQFFYWVRSDVSLYKAPQAAAISPFLISPTHPTHTWGDRPQHRELRPLLFSTSAWVL